MTAVFALPADLLEALDAEAQRRGILTGTMVEQWLRRQLEHVGRVRAIRDRAKQVTSGGGSE